MSELDPLKAGKQAVDAEYVKSNGAKTPEMLKAIKPKLVALGLIEESAGEEELKKKIDELISYGMNR